ncbi:MAG: glycosyltransferase [Bacteroidia bacterium]|nr:glycosyltransferase family 4 protein [Bacteroidales bacterium]NCD42239.1 glycosyltransferase [Bacteroidia bacterium]MDD2322717.1 glycosyltransferase family 4 protein [Bacteroidales bacterium]MDD3011191.1 glycosyltransferase family 4 protein [Bacteroidales bacterium]MDY0286328.1 glycosyltransferase family 4 protein [Bacteroidales bacterium]
MRIFIICNKSPWPPNEGGSMAMYSIITGLLDAGHQVKVLAVNSDKYAVSMADVPEDFRKNTAFDTVFLTLKVNPWHAFINLFSRKSYNIQRFVSATLRNKIIEILSHNTFDIVNLEMLHTTPYINTIRAYSDAAIVLRAHNIEHLIWERVSKTSRNPLVRFYTGHLARTLKRYELGILGKVDGIAAITPTDADFFRSRAPELPVVAIPFGITHVASAPPVTCEYPSLFHLGSMNWRPNADGIRWFLDEVWPLIHPAFPELKFYLAGRHMPGWLLQRNDPNVINLGEVEDAQLFMYTKSVMIVPLLSGSGIRIKIIEGMMASRTIISTTIGAEGILVTPGKDILLADTPEQFLQAVELVVQNEQRCLAIGAEARKTILEKYDNRRIISQLTAFYQSLRNTD